MIYLLCPIGVRTGGPRAIHQLGSSLQTMGLEVRLIASSGTEHATPVDEFRKYGLDVSPAVEDTTDSVVVSPEYSVGELLRFQQAQRYCWWLSVDNTPLFRGRRETTWRRLGLAEDSFRSRIPKLRRALTSMVAVRDTRRELKQIAHLAQSHYAAAALQCFEGLTPRMLTDYIEYPGASFVEQRRKDHQIQVAFNASRGAALATAAIEAVGAAPRPIRGMTEEEVHATLQESHVYLDLGNHPGKDRLPREAALAHSVVIVAERGSASFYADVPLAQRFKVSVQESLLSNAVASLQAVLSDIGEARAAQDEYRQQIGSQREVFLSEVRAIFGHLL